MTARDVPVRIDDLLSHQAWVRRLAIALTRDADEADDVVQQTWLTALRSPPRDGRSPRGWLGTVLRNAVRARGRAEGRRRRREALVARAAGAQCGDDPARTTARAELHAAVAAAVVALPEPLRRAIVLRHFDELPVAEVARRTGAPLETARSRLRRGRAILRERLARDVGRGRPLAVALLPLTRGNPGPGGALTGAGGIVMTGKIMTAAVVVVLALAGAAWWWSDGPPGDGALEDAATASAPDDAAPAGARSTGRRKRAHVAGEGGAEDIAAAGERRAEAAAKGPAGAAAEDGVAAPPAVEPPLVAARLDERPVTFDVQDATLREVLGRIASYAGVPIDIDLEAVGELEKRTSMNIQGAAARDALRYVAMIADLEVRVETDRVVLHRKGVEWEEGRAVRRLEPVPEPEPPQLVVLKGRVLGPDGAAVAGATVIGLPRMIETDAEGRFAVEVPPREYRVQASAPGFVRSPWARVTIDGGTREPGVVVTLAAVAVAIDVHVETLGQQALPGAIVRVLRRGSQEEAATTGTDGVAHLRETAAGRVTLRVTAKGHAPAERSAVGVAGEMLDVMLTLDPRALSERLRRERTTFEYERTPLWQVVGDLSARWDVTMRLDRYVPRETSEQEVSLRVSDDTLEGALRALGAATGTTFRVDDDGEIVSISTEP